MRAKIQDKTRQNVWMKYGKRCAYCGKLIEDRKNLRVDHILAVRKGGTDDESNLNPSCHDCNFYKDTYSLEDFREQLSLMTDRLAKRDIVYRLSEEYGIIERKKRKKITFFFEEDYLKIYLGNYKNVCSYTVVKNGEIIHQEPFFKNTTMNTLEFSLMCAVYTFAYSQNINVSPIKNVDIFYLDDYIVEAINGRSNLVSEVEYRKFIKTCKKNGIVLRFIKADCERDISIVKGLKKMTENFYNEENMKHLDKSIEQLNTGLGVEMDEKELENFLKIPIDKDTSQ